MDAFQDDEEYARFKAEFDLLRDSEEEGTWDGVRRDEAYRDAGLGREPQHSWILREFVYGDMLQTVRAQKLIGAGNGGVVKFFCPTSETCSLVVKCAPVRLAVSDPVVEALTQFIAWDHGLSVRPYAVVLTPRYSYIIMDHLPKGAKPTTLLSDRDADRVCREMYGRLKCIGIDHRDAEGDNVFVVPRGDGSTRVVVIDFGLSLCDQASTEAAHMKPLLNMHGDRLYIL